MPRAVQAIEIEGREVSVSNLDKPMFPNGFTKGQAIDYYVRISGRLLPHLRGRPVTLKRYPNGVSAKHFYEKNAPSYTPEWVPRFPVPRRSGEADICYVVIDSVPVLVWTVNLANLEMHPFLHCVPNLDTPTALVFDLDPGEGAGILDCARVALLLKRDLGADGLRSFAKGSGSKGIQVYAPLNTPVHYAETHAYARRLAEKMERAHPELVVSSMAKARRRNKVFIDWSQNSDFKTTVAPYSLRAKREKPYVSMPVSWKELSDAIEAGNGAGLYFDPTQALARKRDLFAPVLSLRQALPGAAT